jgi:hypothetical protein
MGTKLKTKFSVEPGPGPKKSHFADPYYFGPKAWGQDRPKKAYIHRIEFEFSELRSQI